ncbi:hypothetical protein M3J09_004260 [Ascochyta lentis]
MRGTLDGGAFRVRAATLRKWIDRIVGDSVPRHGLRSGAYLDCLSSSDNNLDLDRGSGEQEKFCLDVSFWKETLGRFG